MAKSSRIEASLPTSIESEQAVLGAILLDDGLFVQIMGRLSADDFHLEKHRRIFMRMTDLHGRGSEIDDLTLIEELNRVDQLQACDGAAYIASLSGGVPNLKNIDAYAKIIKEKALLRSVIRMGESLQSQALMQGAASEIIGPIMDQLSGLLGSTDSGLLSLRELISKDLPATLGTRRTEGTVSTGFMDLDAKLGTLKKGDLIVIAARPAQGKTALAMNIVHNVARNNQVVAVFSLEMSRMALIQRLLCQAAKVNLFNMMNGALNKDDRGELNKSLNLVIDLPIYIDDKPALSVTQMLSSARRLQMTHGLDLVVLDYLQLVGSGGGRRYDNRAAEVSEISTGCKNMAKSLNVPIIALSQLNRECEKQKGHKRPMMSHLRESGTIEADASIVGFIYRPEVYIHDRDDLKGVAELIVAKNRNGPTGTIDLIFQREFTLFSDTTKEFDGYEQMQ